MSRHPRNAIVNADGCPVFQLPVNNFDIYSTGLSCVGSDNGSISVNAVESLTYTLTVDGPDYYNIIDFTNEIEVGNLKPGSYEACITIEAYENYQQCYTLNVTEPEGLQVTAMYDTYGQNLTLNLKGGNMYTISVNEEKFVTRNDTFSITLGGGLNQIEVVTDKDCQGKYQEQFFGQGSLVTIYPNPVRNNFQVNLSTRLGDSVQLSIYDLEGKLIKTEAVDANKLRKVKANYLSTGVYLVKIEGNGRSVSTKLIKNNNEVE